MPLLPLDWAGSENPGSRPQKKKGLRTRCRMLSGGPRWLIVRGSRSEVSKSHFSGFSGSQCVLVTDCSVRAPRFTALQAGLFPVDRFMGRAFTSLFTTSSAGLFRCRGRCWPVLHYCIVGWPFGRLLASRFRSLGGSWLPVFVCEGTKTVLGPPTSTRWPPAGGKSAFCSFFMLAGPSQWPRPRDT